MEIDLNNKCRVCLSDDNLHNLFAEFDQGINLIDIFKNTTNFEVDINDGLPSYLCQNCTNIIVDFYNLKAIYVDNQKQIEILLNQPKIIDDNDTDNNAEIKMEVVSQEIQNEEIEDIQKTDNIELEMEEIRKYICSECGKSFFHQNGIKKHMQNKHDINISDFDEFCDVTHIKFTPINDEDKNVKKSCQVCKEKFPSYETLKEHLDKHKKHTCEICGLGFVKKSYLEDHKDVHTTEKRHICEFCDKAFQRRTVLIKHRRIHTHPRECVCEICGRAFNDKGTLKTHIMLIHVKNRDFVCMICGQQFPLKSTLDKHIQRHQDKGREFQCEICPLAYKDKSSLDRHVNTKHKNEHKIARISCESCGKQFANVDKLQKHTATCQKDVNSLENGVLEDNVIFINYDLTDSEN